jgi:hypothetical protein
MLRVAIEAFNGVICAADIAVAQQKTKKKASHYGLSRNGRHCPLSQPTLAVKK